MYMRHGDVYILGVTKTNANVMMAFQFMTNVSSQALHGINIGTHLKRLQYQTSHCWTRSIHQLAFVPVSSDGKLCGRPFSGHLLLWANPG